MSDSKKISLLDLEGLSDVTNNLVNKLADGVSWIANRETPDKIALNTYIEDIQKSDYAPIVKAALISNAKQTIKEYCNQNDIVQIAMNSIEESAKPECLDNDWLAQFMDKARLVSDKEFQIIWGKILATECNEVDTVPKVLLHTLIQMDKEDAKAFSALRSISVLVDGEYTPIVIKEKWEHYERLGITFDNIVDLKALGLIEMDLGPTAPGYSFEKENTPLKVSYFDKKYEFPESIESIDVGNIILTKSGQALCRAITVEKVEGFWETYCLPLWQKSEGKEQ